jgi:outer membrane protein assembly factor BamB
MRNKVLLLLLWCACFTHAEPPSFRFAWLTDTHVGSPTGEEDLRRSVADINALANIPFVIVSGDVTEMGSTQELELAKRMLDSLRMPYHIIPGNHDTKWSESGCSMFPRLWKDDKFVFEYGGVRFIGCSSGPNMRMGDGHVPQEDVRWLDAELSHMRNKKQPVIFINHYPLDSGLDNWYDIIDRIKNVNTVAALCGHGHGNHALSFEGVPGIMARSNLRAGKSVSGYTLVDVRADSIVFTERTPGMSVSGIERPWYAIANVRHRYDLDTTRYPRPDTKVNKKYPAVRVLWQTNTGYTIGCAPAVSGNTIIVGNNKGFIEAYSLRNGKKLWSRKTGASVYSTPAIGVERAVVGSSDGTIYCLNVKDGAVVWKHAVRGPVVASPLIADGTVYCGSSDGVFRALSLATGETKWEYAGVAGFVESTPLLYQNNIVFGAWDTFLYALNSRTGELVWKWANGNPVRNLSPAACTPVGAGGKIFIVAPDRYMTAIDAATGMPVWRSSTHQVRESIGISVDSTAVFVRTMNDTLFAFASAAAAPKELWKLDCRYGYDIDPSMPEEKDGSIFFGTKNGLVYCIDARAHEVPMCHKLGNTVINTVRPLSSREVIVSSMDGIIARIKF